MRSGTRLKVLCKLDRMLISYCSDFSLNELFGVAPDLLWTFSSKTAPRLLFKADKQSTGARSETALKLPWSQSPGSNLDIDPEPLWNRSGTALKMLWSWWNVVLKDNQLERNQINDAVKPFSKDGKESHEIWIEEMNGG